MIVAPPTPTERELIARCLMDTGILIGSVDEIWSHQSAFRALSTFRMCVDVIGRLLATRKGVYPSMIKSTFADLYGTGPQFALDEIAEFLYDDGRARQYWDGVVQDDRFPHRCPLCKTAAAYIGLNQVECKSRCASSSSRR